jgi:uracil-DNA glycosylase
MYIALKKDYPTFVEPPNKGGLLIPWADRGVLMLNTCLTVRAHEAFSHANRGWERLTQKIIDLISKKRTRGVVFMAWGTPAGKRVQKVDKQRHLVLNSVHPSPLSASRGFFDCKHFKLANEWLIQRYGPDGEIDWALRPGNTTKTPPKIEKVVEVVEKKDEERSNKENDEWDGDEFGSGDEAALEEALRLSQEQVKKET